jgi:hypothetical protein
MTRPSRRFWLVLSFGIGCPIVVASAIALDRALDRAASS